jgi:hypothetical protein
MKLLLGGDLVELEKRLWWTRRWPGKNLIRCHRSENLINEVNGRLTGWWYWGGVSERVAEDGVDMVERMERTASDRLGCFICHRPDRI